MVFHQCESSCVFHEHYFLKNTCHIGYTEMVFPEFSRESLVTKGTLIRSLSLSFSLSLSLSHSLSLSLPLSLSSYIYLSSYPSLSLSVCILIQFLTMFFFIVELMKMAVARLICFLKDYFLKDIAIIYIPYCLKRKYKQNNLFLIPDSYKKDDNILSYFNNCNLVVNVCAKFERCAAKTDGGVRFFFIVTVFFQKKNTISNFHRTVAS